MTMEEKDKWMNEEALQRDAEVIAEMTEIMMEKIEDMESFLKCRK
jgi:hypothetical protein